MHLDKTYDIIVIGSGLAGLVAALHTQSAGLRTLVIERRTEPGGLCGTFRQDGYEFVLGCNEFGNGLARELRSLGVDISFHHPRTRFCVRKRTLQLPADVCTGARLLPKLPTILRAIGSAKKNPNQTLGELIDRHIRDPFVADLACILSYGMLRSPDDVPLRMMKDAFSKEFAYGYDKSTTPVGGPKVMIERMIQRFQALGGELWLGCDTGDIEDGAIKWLQTSAGTLRSTAILSSVGRWEEYPQASKPGLEVAMLLFAMNSDFAYPKGVHTIGYFAPGLAELLRQLESGRWITETSFHCFRSDLPKKSDHYTMNVVIPMPRGVRKLASFQQKELESHVLGKLEELLPGFHDSVRYQYFLSAAEYEERFQLKSAPSPWIAPNHFQKPPSYDPKRDIYYLGTSVHPPGEHAGAAALSGKLAAQEALRQQAQSKR